MTPTDSFDDAKLYFGDARDVLASMPDNSVECVITDPPYSGRTHRGYDASANGHGGEGKDGADRKSLGYGAWSEADVAHFIPEICRVSSGWVVMMTDHTLMPVICRLMESAGRYVFAPLPFYAPGSRCRLSGDGPSSWTIWIVVCRTAKQLRWGTLPGGYSPDGSPGWRDKEHMGGKPSALMRALVRDYSRPGDTVLDPFMGAGTTGFAAAMEFRKFVGVEIEPAYYEASRKRIAAAMGVGSRQLVGQRNMFEDMQ